MKSLVFILSYFFFCHLNGQIIVNQDTFFKGNISKISLTNQNYELTENTWFDNNKEIKKNIYKNNELEKSITYIYNGDYSEKTETFYKDNVSFKKLNFIFFKNKLIKQINFEGENQKEENFPYKIQYKENNELRTYIKKLDEKDSFIYSIYYYNNDKIIPDSEVYYFKSGNVNYKVFNSFNEQNLPVKRILTDAKGNYFKYKEFIYENNLKSKVISFNNLKVSDFSDFSKETIDEEQEFSDEINEWFSDYYEFLTTEKYIIEDDIENEELIKNFISNDSLLIKTLNSLNKKMILSDLDYIIKFEYYEDKSLKLYQKYGLEVVEEIEKIILIKEEQFYNEIIIPKYHTITLFKSFNHKDTLETTKQEIYNYWSSDSLTFFNKTITNEEDTVKIERIFKDKQLHNQIINSEYTKQIFYYDSYGNIFKKEFYERKENEKFELIRSVIYLIEYKD